MEYWSVGVMLRLLMSFFATLHYSITPILPGETLRNFAVF